MKQLTGLDTSFLNMETSTQFGHVNSITDPRSVDDGRAGDPYATFKRVEERLHLLEIYRRKLVSDPLGLDNPYWVDDADLDLEYHIRELALPPAGRRCPAGRAGGSPRRPTTRSVTRPLWEWYVISGLEADWSGCSRSCTTPPSMGHPAWSCIHVLLDTEPEGSRSSRPSEPWVPEPHAHVTPSSSAAAVRPTSCGPARCSQLQARMLRATSDLTGNPAFRQMAADLARRPAGPTRCLWRSDPVPTRPAPSTPFNRTITAHRRFAFRTLRLSDAETVKRAFGVTVNDVVMALCAAVASSLPPRSSGACRTNR